jgi:septal ring factor EnvC (AmiA/AmiB activator)
MNAGQLIAAITGLVSVLGAATGIISILVVRRGQKETAHAKERVDSFEMMKELVEQLRTSLNDANEDVDEVNNKLREAETKAGKLNDELNVALANIGILQNKLTEHDIPIPYLRRTA